MYDIIYIYMHNISIIYAQYTSYLYHIYVYLYIYIYINLDLSFFYPQTRKPNCQTLSQTKSRQVANPSHQRLQEAPLNLFQQPTCWIRFVIYTYNKRKVMRARNGENLYLIIFQDCGPIVMQIFLLLPGLRPSRPWCNAFVLRGWKCL